MVTVQAAQSSPASTSRGIAQFAAAASSDRSPQYRGRHGPDQNLMRELLLPRPRSQKSSSNAAHGFMACRYVANIGG